jgi:DNA-directed RNA polymerase specialized sigma24 family protein
VIRAVLRSKGIRGKEDLQDAEQEVLIRCIKHVRATGRPPEDEAEAKAIARRVAERFGIDDLKKRVRQAKTIDRSEHDPEEHARDDEALVNAIDRKRYASALEREITEKQAKQLIDIDSGVPQAEIARDDDVTVESVRKETERARRRARAKLLTYGIATFAAAVGVVGFVHVGPWGDSGDVTSSPLDYAAEQRRFAAQACQERKWDECAKALDRAAEDDPEGDHSAQVKGLREMVTAARGGSAARDGGGGGE